MGYRSDVAYTIRFIPIVQEHEGIDENTAIERAKATFFTFLAEAKAKHEIAGAFDDEYIKVDEDNLAIYFYAGHVKWYESYEDVKCHEALMDLSKEWADDEDCSNPYIGGAFARIGEEMEDVVEECWGQGDYDWISVHRSMHCDWMD
jgi:hypothetical protein